MASTLPDHEARRRIAGDLGSNLFVEAGAGTGKTTELVGRLLALVRSGVPIANIAAITFTEAAAAELRERVRFALEGWVREPREPRDREIAGAALAGLDGAALETLHGFARRLLAHYPIEARLPPGFDVLDEVAYRIVADEEWDTVIATLLDDGSMQTALTYALAMGVRIRARRGNWHLRAVFDAFDSNWDRLPREPFQAAGFTEPDFSRLIELLGEAASMRHECRDPSDSLYEWMKDIDRKREQLTAAPNAFERARLLAWTMRWGGRRRGRQGNWPDVEAVRAAVLAARDERDRLVEELSASVLMPILERLRLGVLTFSERRRRDGTLSFHDLLVRARDLLRDSPEARRGLHARFTRILVDEFQDTDPLQVEIAGLIARSDDGEPVEPGRVFFVGDAKQSIYRFRRADIATFRRAREEFACELVTLTSNFRSAGEILDWCNAVIGPMFDGGHEAQADYQALAMAREDGPTGTVHAMGGPLEALPVAAIRELEAEAVAGAIRAVREQGWQVLDRRTGATRPARFDDIAVLIRSRTIQPALERALEDQGIPYRVESRSLVYNTQQVRDLTSILAAIDDPTDDVAVVAALRSPAFACGDDDLVAHVKAGGRWDYVAHVAAGREGNEAVDAAFRHLDGLHAERHWLPLGELVERVIRERRLRELAFAARRPQETWQRYRFLLEQVRQLEATQGATLGNLVSWLRRQADDFAQVNETVAPEEHDEAVRVMTAHAAKGLEFPVVILAGFNTTPPAGGPVLWPAGSGPQVKLGTAQTSGYQDASQEERELDRLERTRLLYVAATRARDHLVVSLFHPAGKESDAADLFDRCQAAPGTCRPLVTAVQAALPAVETAGGTVPTSLPSLEEWQAERLRLLASQRRLPSVAATALAHERGDDGDALESDRPFRRGRGSTALGRAVHAVLQSVDLETGEGVEALALAEAAAEAIGGRAQEVARLARAAVDSDAVRDAVASGRYWREVFVSSPVGDSLVEGFIDLLYETPDGLAIIDYKTDDVATSEQAVAVAARYRLQGAAYAFALQKTLGRPVSRCRFVFLRPPGTAAVDIPDLRQAVTEVEGAVSAMA